MEPRILRRAVVLVSAAVLPLALARVEAVGERLPFLGVLRGPLGLVWLTVALAVAVTGAGPAWLRRLRPPGSAVLFLLSFAAYAALGVHYTSRLQVSGDEPYYLLMAQSLWQEHDLDLEDNFAREDWRAYTPGPLSTHYGTPRRDGRPYPTHSPGLSALLAPAYAAGGRTGCVLLLAAVAALLAREVHRLAWRLTADPAAAFAAWAATAGPPLLFYAFHVYTEAASALCLVAGLNLVLGAPGIAGAAAAALLASCLPWLHVKMVPAAAALGLVAVARLRRAERMAFVSVAAVTALAYMAYYQHVFGRPSSLGIYGGLPADARSSPLAAIGGLFLDRSFGLLPHAPVFLLGLAGLAGLASRASRDTWPHLLVGFCALAPVLTWRMWWGGQCPPGRFLVPLLPVLAAGLALRRVAPVRGLARWGWTLTALGVGLACYMSADPARLLLLNRGNRPTRVWAALSGDTPVEGYLPSLTLPDATEVRVAAVWLVALLVLLVLDRLAQRHDRVDRWFRGLTLPALLLVFVGLAVDGWARPSRPPGPSQLDSRSCQRSFSRTA